MRVLSAIVCFAALSCSLGPASADDAKLPTPAVVAHRGLLLDAPENTLANFEACLQLRIGFEFDVRRSRDGVLVCLHDDTVDRTTDGHGRCSELTLAELQQLDAGAWFSPAYRGQRIPTIDALFQLIAAHKVTGLYAADLKGADAEIERDVVKLAVRHGIIDRLLFIGRAIDNAEVRHRLRSADGRSHIAVLANNREELARAVVANVDWVYLRFVPTEADVNEIWGSGKKSFIAGKTVAGLEQANWSAATKAGVNAILTDHALLCRRLVSLPPREPAKP